MATYYEPFEQPEGLEWSDMAPPEEQPIPADPLGAEFFQRVAQTTSQPARPIGAIYKEATECIRTFIPGQNPAFDCLIGALLSDEIALQLGVHPEIVSLRNKVVSRINTPENPDSPQAILKSIAEHSI